MEVFDPKITENYGLAIKRFRIYRNVLKQGIELYNKLEARCVKSVLE
jgi:hypothetical protein